MFFKYTDSSVRFIGRWAEYDNSMTATTTGAKIQIAFNGDYAVLKFNVRGMIEPLPHIWLSLDGGKTRFETAVRRYLRIECNQGEHLIEVVIKSATEVQNRWYAPLQARVSFEGFEASKNAALPEFTKKTIEFVGDSITEGILVDENQKITEQNDEDDELNRPYQNDATATYAYLIAKNIGFEPVIMGYGASGVTHGGCGGVPACTEGYPYCFDSAKKTYPSSDIIVINHAANDWMADKETEISAYKKLLGIIRKLNPKSKIVSLGGFKCTHHDDIIEAVSQFNEENDDDVFAISTKGWIEEHPLHPGRDGHKIVADNVTAILKEKYKDLIG